MCERTRTRERARPGWCGFVCVAVCYRVLPLFMSVCSSVLQWQRFADPLEVCCSVFQCVAVCCNGNDFQTPWSCVRDPHVYTHTFTHTCTHTRTHTCFRDSHMHTHTHLYTQSHKHTHTNTRTHTHTHTPFHTFWKCRRHVTYIGMGHVTHT